MTHRTAIAQIPKADTSRTRLDSHRLRRDFPLLQEALHKGVPLAYLDNAATTQKPMQVIEALHEYYTSYNSNVHRALHRLGEQATLRFEEARTKVAAFIGAPSTRSIVFTRGTTESINIVAHTLGRCRVQDGDIIMLTGMEHHSNLVPWQLLAKQRNAKLEFIPICEDGTLDLDAFESMLTERVRLVSVTHMSNVLGTIHPVKRIVDSAHRVGAKVLIDGAQSVPHFPIDVESIGCDFLAFSGHKMAGPTGIGVLYGKEELLEEMPPFMGGGEMISKVTLESSTWAELPYKFEAGTPHIAGAIGLGAAVDYLNALGMDCIHQRESELTTYALQKLGEIRGLRILGCAPERGGIISFIMDAVHPHDLSQFVDQNGVAIRAGHMCCQPLMHILGVQSVSRASFYLYNTEEEVDQLIEALDQAMRFFSNGI